MWLCLTEQNEKQIKKKENLDQFIGTFFAYFKVEIYIQEIRGYICPDPCFWSILSLKISDIFTREQKDRTYSKPRPEISPNFYLGQNYGKAILN